MPQKAAMSLFCRLAGVPPSDRKNCGVQPCPNVLLELQLLGGNDGQGNGSKNSQNALYIIHYSIDDQDIQ